MNSHVSVRLSPAQLGAGIRADRLFFSAAGVIMLAVVLVGFRHFYFQGGAYPGRSIDPSIKGLVIAHAATMGGWMTLFIVQALLVATRRVRLHMRLGWTSLALCAAVVVSGLWLTVASTRIQPEGFILFTLTGTQFMAVSMLTLAVFVGFIAVAVWKRKKPAIHRPLMLLAALSVTPAAIARIDQINALYQGTALEGLFGPFLPTIVLAGMLLAARCLVLRSFDRCFAIGLAALALASMAIMRIATTSVWVRFAESLVA